MRKCSIVLAASLMALPLGSALAGNTQQERPRNSTDTLTVVFTGDILLDRGVRQCIGHGSADRLFSLGIDSLFRTADLVVGNLECPATKIVQPVFKRYIFRGEPEWLATLKAHGVTHLNLANNHAIDQGREGLMDTRRNIVAAGMVPIGAGQNMSETSQPVLLAKEPRPVWLLASNRLALENFAYLPDRPCVSQEPFDSLVDKVRQLKNADSTAIIIVSMHWGGEHTLKPLPQQRMEARRLIDAGAEALICHHTHTLQTIENYHGHRIYYSIGNFIFDQKKPMNRQACVVKLTVTKEMTDIETIPVVIENCVPRLEALQPGL